MLREPVDSSNIASVGYEPSTGLLEIEFTNGSRVYQYDRVPQDVVTELLTAVSIGGFFYRNIRMSYPYRRIQ
jgi:hypothetical protein